MQNIEELKLTQETPQGKSYLRLDKLSAVQVASPGEKAAAEGESEDIQVEESGTDSQETNNPSYSIPSQKQIPKQIFVAHGKNMRPLEQLKNILGQFKVPFLRNQAPIPSRSRAGRPVPPLCHQAFDIEWR